MNLVKEAKICKIGITVFMVLVVLALILLACTGCGAKEADAEELDRFALEQIEPVLGGDSRAYILTDNETGAQYLVIRAYNQLGITWLQPASAEEG